MTIYRENYEHEPVLEGQLLNEPYFELAIINTSWLTDKDKNELIGKPGKVGGTVKTPQVLFETAAVIEDEINYLRFYAPDSFHRYPFVQLNSIEIEDLEISHPRFSQVIIPEVLNRFPLSD